MERENAAQNDTRKHRPPPQGTENICPQHRLPCDRHLVNRRSNADWTPTHRLAVTNCVKRTPGHATQ